MTRKTEFHAVAFFRKVRDQQAAELAGRTPEQIIAFFSRARERAVGASKRSHAKRGGASR